MSFKSVIFGLALWLLLACQRMPSADDPVARVNGQSILLKDYLRVYENLKPKESSLSGQDKIQMKNLALQTLVRRAVVLTTAEKEKIIISPDELEKGLDRFRAGYTDQSFKESLLEGMVDESEWKEQVRQSLLVEKLFEKSSQKIEAPTEEEAMAYFEQNPRNFRRAGEIRAQHIVVSDKKLATEIYTSLSQKKESFIELARKYSIGPEGQTDAIIEFELGTMPQQIEDELLKIPFKRVSSILESEYGFHIFRVLDRSAEMNLDFAQVKSRIYEILYEERRRDWMDKFEENLIRSAKIEYNRELIRSL